MSPVPSSPGRANESFRAGRIRPNSRAELTGRMILADVYNTRNLRGIKRGEIKRLLVLESLPKQVNFSGGPDLVSWLGTFTLERVLGTVPVEQDGSAYLEVPASRQLFFAALDENDLSVKRMQSFTGVMPGEVVGCVGCHEHRMPALTPPCATKGPSTKPRWPSTESSAPRPAYSSAVAIRVTTPEPGPAVLQTFRSTTRPDAKPRADCKRRLPTMSASYWWRLEINRD